MEKEMKSAYISWQGMKSRCSNPNNKVYKYYGQRNITVCERWMSFKNFYSDMGERAKGYSLDRINNDGNYEPRVDKALRDGANRSGLTLSNYIKLILERSVKR